MSKYRSIIQYKGLIVLAVLGIIAYFINQETLFYICTSKIAVIWIVTVFMTFAFANSSLNKIVVIGATFAYCLIGYFVTRHIISGTLLGLTLTPFVGLFEYIIKRK